MLAVTLKLFLFFYSQTLFSFVEPDYEREKDGQIKLFLQF